MVDARPYLDAWRARRQAQKQTDAASAADARMVAQRLSNLLRDEFHVRRVVLIGSLARGDFREGSDIDLVVSGLQVDDLFRCGARLEDVARPFPVDLVPLESANPRLHAAVADEGVVLFGGD